MSESDITPELHPANEVVAKLYSTVADNKNMPEFFSAWDNFVEHVFANNPDEIMLWQSRLNEHFEQAGPLVLVTKPSSAEEKQEFVDRQTFPAILFNSRFSLVAKNQQVDAIWPLPLDADVSNSILPPFDHKRVLDMQASALEHPDPVLVSLDIGSDGNSSIVMAVVHAVEFTTGDGTAKEPLFVLRIAQPRWYSALGRMLANTYALTESEIEVARGLYQNKTLISIAEERDRSIRTVRTQLSQVFDKTGASSQAELIGMISNLGQILELGKKNTVSTTQSRYHSTNADVKIYTCDSTNGHQLSYAVFGDPEGCPVLAIQPTAPPEMTERFRNATRDAGLRFIVPHKPGSGQASSRNYRYTPQLAAQDYQEILDAEQIDQASVVGLFSGGIYALEFANVFPSRVKNLILADTGVPLKPPGDFLKMSSSARRTFLPARFLPQILLTPHKMVAKDFHESEAGQKRVVEYFFNGTPIDLSRVKHNKEYYNVTRDMIAYSFEDIKQLVDNVCLWASDWQSILDTAAEQHDICFLHGEHNDVFMFDAVKAYAAKMNAGGQSSIKTKAVSDNSQLSVFVNPQALMELL